MKEEMLLLGRIMVQYMNPKMQRIFLQKASTYIKVDYDDPNVYTEVDEN